MEEAKSNENTISPNGGLKMKIIFIIFGTNNIFIFLFSCIFKESMILLLLLLSVILL